VSGAAAMFRPYILPTSAKGRFGSMHVVNRGFEALLRTSPLRHKPLDCGAPFGVSEKGMPRYGMF
jgi:hypothetical protein